MCPIPFMIWKHKCVEVCQQSKAFLHRVVGTGHPREREQENAWWRLLGGEAAVALRRGGHLQGEGHAGGPATLCHQPPPSTITCLPTTATAITRSSQIFGTTTTYHDREGSFPRPSAVLPHPMRRQPSCQRAVLTWVDGAAQWYCRAGRML